MKQFILIALCIVSLEASSQIRGTGKIVPDDFIGTWKLTKLADVHLDYRPDSVKMEQLRFTKDSVFVTTEDKQYSGTWKLIEGQTVINILETNQFNYKWIAGDDNSKFFTTKRLGYYKCFIRVAKNSNNP